MITDGNIPDAIPSRAGQRSSVQFGLASLVGLVFVSAVTFAVARFDVGLGVSAGLIILLGLLIWRFKLFRSPTLTEIAVLLVVFALEMAMFIPAFTCCHGRGAGKRTQCRNNLKQIGLALQLYHMEWGSYPPAITSDSAGTPIHSWRVLILPYLDCRSLYASYRLDEPWDGPHNRTLAAHMPEIYACPSGDSARTFNTNYLAILGDETAWPVDGARCVADFSDRLGQTIQVVEVNNSGIHWMEPRDLDVLQMNALINSASGQGISSRHPGGANVLYADSSVRFLVDTVDPEKLADQISANGQ